MLGLTRIAKCITYLYNIMYFYYIERVYWFLWLQKTVTAVITITIEQCTCRRPSQICSVLRTISTAHHRRHHFHRPLRPQSAPQYRAPPLTRGRTRRPGYRAAVTSSPRPPVRRPTTTVATRTLSRCSRHRRRPPRRSIRVPPPPQPPRPSCGQTPRPPHSRLITTVNITKEYYLKSSHDNILTFNC